MIANLPSARVLKEGGYEGATSQIAFGMPGTWKRNIETLIYQEVEKLVHTVEDQP